MAHAAAATEGLWMAKAKRLSTQPVVGAVCLPTAILMTATRLRRPAAACLIHNVAGDVSWLIACTRMAVGRNSRCRAVARLCAGSYSTTRHCRTQPGRGARHEFTRSNSGTWLHSGRGSKCLVVGRQSRGFLTLQGLYHGWDSSQTATRMVRCTFSYHAWRKQASLFVLWRTQLIPAPCV